MADKPPSVSSVQTTCSVHRGLHDVCRCLSGGVGFVSTAPGCLWWLWSGSESCNNLLGLLEIVVGGAPEDEASGDFSNGYGNVEFCGHAEDAVLHRGWTCAIRESHAGCGVVQRLNVLREGMIKLRIHPGPAAHAASFVERHILKFDGRGSPGHRLCLLCLCGWVARIGHRGCAPEDNTNGVRLADRGARGPRGFAADPEGSSDPHREPLGDDR